MSFFDLENELPKWLDEEIITYTGLSEITLQADIKTLDQTSLVSYHSMCAAKGNMVTQNSNGHHIWKFQTPKRNIRTYGKYLDFSGKKGSEKFWLGLVVIDGIMNMYLWFGTKPSQIIQQLLQLLLSEEIENREYWYSNQQTGINPISYILSQYCGCCTLPLNQNDLALVEKAIKKEIHSLLDVVEQVVN